MENNPTNPPRSSQLSIEAAPPPRSEKPERPKRAPKAEKHEAPKPPAKQKPLTDQILQAMRKLEPEKNMPVMVTQVLRYLDKDTRKVDFDSAVVQLIMQKRLTLVWNTPPEGHTVEEYEELTVHTYFALLRTGED